MTDFNSYWPIYKNLEDETLQLTKYINFSDDQLKVYSMYIADLIIRIVIEIEDISKELYKINGGSDMYDNQGHKRDLFFDTDCINYLNDIWGICNRTVIVSCTSFNFTNDQYKILQPLKKANKRGSSSTKWNKAYQAVKHNRRNNLKKGNIENLILALGALYILNIYYRNEILEYDNSFFDGRLGSEIFSVSFVDASKVAIGTDESDNAINKEEREKIPTALCIIKYTDETWKILHDSFKNYNDKIAKGLRENPELIKNIEKKINGQNINFENIAQMIITEMQTEYIRKHPPIEFGRLIANGKKEIILNKAQSIYKR